MVRPVLWCTREKTSRSATQWVGETTIQPFSIQNRGQVAHQDIMVKKVLKARTSAVFNVEIQCTHKLNGMESGATPGLVGVNNKSAMERRCSIMDS